MLELDLLCEAGAGLEAIAPRICRIVRQWIGAEAVALFWLDENGLPLGFHHEHSPASAQDLFLNEFERLFIGPDELNVFTLATSAGALTGRLLAPDPGYYRSNTFNLLVRPSGHHHAIDLRIDAGGRPRAVLLAFRHEAQPFTDREACTLPSIAPALQKALRVDGATVWRVAADDADRAFLLVDPTGEQVLEASPGLPALLARCMLVGQNIRLTKNRLAAPRFAQEMCTARSGSGTVRTFPVPDGRLVVTAMEMAPHGDDRHRGNVLIGLTIERPGKLDLAGHIAGLGLSPLRSRLAFYAATGGSRAEASRRFGMSKEALKKHLGEIYGRAGVQGWSDLGGLAG